MQNVFEDLGFSAEEATVLAFKADLYAAILERAKRYSQKDLQIILGEPSTPANQKRVCWGPRAFYPSKPKSGLLGTPSAAASERIAERQDRAQERG